MGFKRRIALPVPEVTGETSVPRPGAAGSHCVAEPPLDAIPLVPQVVRSDAGIRQTVAG